MTSPSHNSGTTESSTSDPSPADLAQAFRDLARGEQAATTMEANLSNLESKLDAILAALEAKAAAGSNGNENSTGKTKGTREEEEGVDKANQGK